MAHGVATHMGLIEHGALPRHVGAALLAPGKRRVDHPAFRHERRAVALVERQIGVRRAERVAEQRRVPLQLADDLAGVGIEQQLVGVEAVAFGRRVRAMHAVAIDLARPRIGQITVPDLIGVFRQLDALDLAATATLEQAQLDLGGVCRKQREIDAEPIPGGAERKWPALEHAMAQDRRSIRGHAADHTSNLVHGKSPLFHSNCHQPGTGEKVQRSQSPHAGTDVTASRLFRRAHHFRTTSTSRIVTQPLG